MRFDEPWQCEDLHFQITLWCPNVFSNLLDWLSNLRCWMCRIWPKVKVERFVYINRILQGVVLQIIKGMRAISWATFNAIVCFVSGWSFTWASKLMSVSSATSFFPLIPSSMVIWNIIRLVTEVWQYLDWYNRSPIEYILIEWFTLDSSGSAEYFVVHILLNATFIPLWTRSLKQKVIKDLEQII